MEARDKFVAIWDARINDYKWYSVAQAQRNHQNNLGKPTPEGCTVEGYIATGRFVTREDGEIAEIFEPTTAAPTTASEE